MERVYTFFQNMGLSEKETRIYLILAKNGPAKASEIHQKLKIDRVQIYRLLRNLQGKGIIECTFEYPASYIAVPFRKLLNLQIRTKKEEAKSLEERMEELIAQFDIKQPEVEKTSVDRFMVLDGIANIYSKIGQMIQQAKKTVIVVSSNYGIISAYNAGLFDYGFNHPLKDKLWSRFLTNLSAIGTQIETTKEIIDKMKRTPLNFEYNIGDFGAGLFPRFVLKDENELILFLKMAEENPSVIQNETGLWTNNQVLVHAFIAFFEEMWSKSRKIFDEIEETENTR